MNDRRKLAWTGIIIFLIGTVLMFPARVAYNWFVPESIRLNGVTGTIWNGMAAEGIADGFYFTNLHWVFEPLYMVRGVASIAVSADTAGGSVSTSAGVAIGGSLLLTDFVGSLPLASIHPALQQNRISGLLNIQLQKIKMQDGWPTLVIGSIGIGNLVAGAIGPEPLGNFRAEVSTENGIVRAVVEDAGAVLDVTGNIELGEGRAYSLVGFVSANKDTPPTINQNLRFLGSADANGQRPFRFEGSL